MPDDEKRPEREQNGPAARPSEGGVTEPTETGEDSHGQEPDLVPDREDTGGQQVDIDELASRLQEAESEIEDLNRRYLRALADYDNARKRAQAEREGLRTSVICDFVSHLLPAIDSLDRAIELGEQADAQSMLEGIKMVRSQISDVLGSEGISCIKAVGTQFDPNKHDALMQVELDDCEDNTVVEELQKGYEAAGRVIRPSIVKVNKIRA